MSQISIDAATLGTLVREVRGVDDLYPVPAIPLLGAILAPVSGALGDAPEVRTDTVGGADEVAVRVAASIAVPAPETARAVAEVLLAHTPPGTRIRVQVARIH